MQAQHLTMSGRLLLAIFIVIYSIASYFGERNYGGDWASWNHVVGAIALIWYLKSCWKARREVVLTGFMQIYYSVGLLLSAAFVSGGMYMFEVAQYGDQNGIFWVVLAFFVAGFEAAGLGYRLGGLVHFGSGVKKLSRGTGKSLILLIIVASLVICAYVFVSYRGPVLLGVDRVTFWREIAPTYLSFVPTLVTQSFFFVAFFFLWSRRSGCKSWAPMVFLVAYILAGLFVLGQKFSLFILFITVWFALLPGIYPNFIFQRVHLFALLGALAFLVTSVLVSYSLQGQEAGFALARIALQAQVLWSVFDDPQAHNLWSGDWNCYFGCGKFANGIDFIMYRYLPFDLYSFYSEGGTILSGFMPALSILTMGLAASMLIHLLVSFVLGMLQRKLVSAISDKNLIYSFLLYKTHIGLTLIWFAAMETAIVGLIAVLLLICLYRLRFPSVKAKLKLSNPYSTVRIAAI